LALALDDAMIPYSEFNMPRYLIKSFDTPAVAILPVFTKLMRPTLPSYQYA
jgi:hypothetical protein